MKHIRLLIPGLNKVWVNEMIETFLWCSRTENTSPSNHLEFLKLSYQKLKVGGDLFHSHQNVPIWWYPRLLPAGEFLLWILLLTLIASTHHMHLAIHYKKEDFWCRSVEQNVFIYQYFTNFLCFSRSTYSG